MFSMNFHDMFFESRTLHRGLSMFWCHTKESCPWQTFRPRHLSCWRCSITALGGNHRLTKLETNNGKKGPGFESDDINWYRLIFRSIERPNWGAARPMLCCHWMRDGLYMWKRIACTLLHLNEVPCPLDHATPFPWSTPQLQRCQPPDRRLPHALTSPCALHQS